MEMFSHDFWGQKLTGQLQYLELLIIIIVYYYILLILLFLYIIIIEPFSHKSFRPFTIFTMR